VIEQLRTTSLDDALARLAVAIAAAQRDAPLAPVWVVAGSQVAGITVKRALAQTAGGLANVRVVPLTEAAQRWAAMVGVAPAGSLGIWDATRRALAEQPGPLGAAHDHVRTIDSVARLVGDAPGAVAVSSPWWTTLTNRVRAIVRPAVLSDEVMQAARRGVGGAAPALVVWWFPTSMSSALSVLQRADHLLVIAHPGVRLGPLGGGFSADDADEHGPTDDGSYEGSDEDGWATGDWSDVDDLSVESFAQIDRASGLSDRVVRSIEVSDQRSEAREAVRVALDGARHIGKVALTSPRPELMGLLRDACDDAVVAWSGPSGFTLADTIAGRCLLAVAKLERELPVDAVVSVWSAGPICRLDGSLMDVAQWSHLARSAGVGRSLESWRRRLGALARPAHFAGAEAEVVGDAVDETVSDVDVPLARLVLDDVVRLSEMRPPSSASWRRWTRWATDTVEGLVGPEMERWRHAIGEATPSTLDQWDARRLSEVEAYDSVRTAIGQWATLTDGPVRLDHMVGVLRSLLREPWRRRGGVGEAVIIAPIDALVGADLDRVVIAGLDDESFPPRLIESAVLSALDRRATKAELAQRVAAQRGAWMTLTSLAREVVVLRARRVGQADTHATSALGAFTVNVSSLAGPMTQIRRIACGQVGALSTDELSAAQWLCAPSVANVDERLLGASLSRTDPQVDEFNGVIDFVDLDVEWSPTALENWAHCPRRSLFTKLLGLRSELAPGADDSIDPRERGTIVHDTLEHLVTHFADEHTTLPWSSEARAGAHLKVDALCDHALWQGLAVDGAPWRHEREVLHRELDITLDHDDAWRAQGWVPVMAEASFGAGRQQRPADLPAVLLPTANGEVVRVGGRIDRIDRHQVTGALVATDYKTGLKETEKAITAGLAAGLKLQLPLYAMAARGLTDEDVAASGRYWFISGRGDWTSVALSLTDDVRDTTSAVVAAIADEMAAGHFPGAARRLQIGGDACSGCDFVDVCPTDRYRQWRMTMDSDALSTLRQLSGDASVDDGASGEGGDHD
jgi:ATP-dependent helicase/nuclease subunit B